MKSGLMHTNHLALKWRLIGSQSQRNARITYFITRIFDVDNSRLGGVNVAILLVGAYAQDYAVLGSAESLPGQADYSLILLFTHF